MSDIRIDPSSERMFQSPVRAASRCDGLNKKAGFLLVRFYRYKFDALRFLRASFPVSHCNARVALRCNGCLGFNFARMSMCIHSAADGGPQGRACAVWAALMLIGFSAVIGQIMLMRELMAVFNGNEISLGILLSAWLFWTAIGSLMCSGLALGENHARLAVAALECLLGASLPLTIWALRASKAFFKLCRASWWARFLCLWRRWSA